MKLTSHDIRVAFTAALREVVPEWRLPNFPPYSVYKKVADRLNRKIVETKKKKEQL